MDNYHYHVLQFFQNKIYKNKIILFQKYFLIKKLFNSIYIYIDTYFSYNFLWKKVFYVYIYYEFGAQFKIITSKSLRLRYGQLCPYRLQLGRSGLGRAGLSGNQTLGCVRLRRSSRPFNFSASPIFSVCVFFPWLVFFLFSSSRFSKGRLFQGKQWKRYM